MTCPDRGGELNRAFLILGAHLRDKKKRRTEKSVRRLFICGSSSGFRFGLVAFVFLRGEEREWMNLLLLHGLEFVWIDSQSFENRWRHLLIRDGDPHCLRIEAGEREKQSGVHVVFVDSAVLRDFRTAGEDHARVDLENDVRGAWIFARAGARDVPLVGERWPRENFLDAEGRLAVRFAQKRDDFGSEVRTRQPDQ